MSLLDDEVRTFVAALAIPADRRAVVLAELLDHAACAREAAVREGRDPEVAARESLGNLEVLRRSLEAIEPAFRVSRARTFGRGLVAALLVALVIDQGGPWMMGLLGGVAAIAICALLAPPRALDLLRAELRAPRVRGTLLRGVPIGPALTYLYTVLSTPFVVWIVLIVVRAFGGKTSVDVPVSSFAVLGAAYLVLLVEGLRARRRVAA